MMFNQKKITLLVFFFMFFFAAVITAAEVKPGDVIDASNVDQYKEYFPAFVVEFIKDGFGGLSEPTSPIHVADLETPLAPESFRKASEKNRGKITINPEDLSLTGFDYSGIPFPEVKEPHKNEKIIANYYYRWRSDDYYHTDDFMISSASKRKGGRVANHNTKSALVRYVGRTAPGFQKDLPNPNGLFWVQMNRFLQPQFKNLRTLQWRYLDPTRDDDMWSYVPTLRRTLRMISSERANPINGTPLTYDDFLGFDGQLSKFSYNVIGTKKMVGNINIDIETYYKVNPNGFYNHPVFHGPDFPFGIADAYVIEVIPKDPKYPESKKVLYMNTLNYMNIYSEVYDKRGEVWKGLCMNVSKTKLETGETGYFNSQMDFDLKTGYWLQIWTNKLIQDSGLRPEIFDPANFYTW